MKLKVNLVLLAMVALLAFAGQAVAFDVRTMIEGEFQVPVLALTAGTQGVSSLIAGEVAVPANGTATAAPVIQTVTVVRAVAGVPFAIKDGETLSEMAQKYTGNKGNWPEIARLNGLSDEQLRRLHVGRKIVIPTEMLLAEFRPADANDLAQARERVDRLEREVATLKDQVAVLERRPTQAELEAAVADAEAVKDGRIARLVETIDRLEGQLEAVNPWIWRLAAFALLALFALTAFGLIQEKKAKEKVKRAFDTSRSRAADLAAELESLRVLTQQLLNQPYAVYLDGGSALVCFIDEEDGLFSIGEMQSASGKNHFKSLVAAQKAAAGDIERALSGDTEAKKRLATAEAAGQIHRHRV